MAKIIKYFPFGGAPSDTNGEGPWYTRISNQSGYVDVGNVWGLWESSAWDPAPTVSLVFLAKVSGPTGYVALFNKTDNIQLSEDVQVSSTTWQLHESAAITMPAGDLKEFIVRAKKAAGDIDIVPLGLKIIQNATTINKTVTYISVAFQDPSGTGGTDYSDPRGPVHYYHEANKFDGTLEVIFEAILKKTSGSSSAMAALTKLDDTIITTVSADAISRQRSASVSLSDLTSYKSRYKAPNAMYPGAILYQALIIIKQTGGVQKTKMHVALDGGWEALDGTKNTYAEGPPNSHKWDPGDIDSVSAVYFEFMGKDPNNYGVYAKLRNHTGNADITGGSLVIQNTSAWGRARTADIFANLPTVSKELRAHRKHGSASGSSSIGNRFLIVEQSWVPTYEAKDAAQHKTGLVALAADAIKHYVALVLPTTKDSVKHRIGTVGWWTKDSVAHKTGLVALVADAVKHAVITTARVRDAVKHRIGLADMEGPKILTSSLSPPLGSRGVLPAALIRATITDNDKVDITKARCVVETYMLNDAQSEVHLQSATYDYNSPEWSHVDFYGDGSRYDIEINPPDFPDGHKLRIKWSAKDVQGNPGLTAV